MYPGMSMGCWILAQGHHQRRGKKQRAKQNLQSPLTLLKTFETDWQEDDGECQKKVF